MKSFEGDVDAPWSAAALICLREDALEPLYDLEAALRGDIWLPIRTFMPVSVRRGIPGAMAAWKFPTVATLS
jgi:hypothetical protein